MAPQQNEYTTFESHGGLEVDKLSSSLSLKAKVLALGFLLATVGAFVGLVGGFSSAKTSASSTIHTTATISDKDKWCGGEEVENCGDYFDDETVDDYGIGGEGSCVKLRKYTPGKIAEICALSQPIDTTIKMANDVCKFSCKDEAADASVTTPVFSVKTPVFSVTTPVVAPPEKRMKAHQALAESRQLTDVAEDNENRDNCNNDRSCCDSEAVGVYGAAVPMAGSCAKLRNPKNSDEKIAEICAGDDTEHPTAKYFCKYSCKSCNIDPWVASVADVSSSVADVSSSVAAACSDLGDKESCKGQAGCKWRKKTGCLIKST